MSGEQGPGQDGGKLQGSRHIRSLSVQSQLQQSRILQSSGGNTDFCCPSSSQRVRAVHRVRLPLLRQRLQHDGRGLRLLFRLPPLQGGGGQEEDRVIWLISLSDLCDLF